MNSNKAYKRLIEFQQRTEISYQQMREMTLTGTPFRIYATKLDGKNIVRDMFSVPGPGGRAMGGTIYWRAPYNYMIYYSQTDGGYRTIVLKNVTKIVQNGRTYFVK
jgi:hypothetical protein